MRKFKKNIGNNTVVHGDSAREAAKKLKRERDDENQTENPALAGDPAPNGNPLPNGAPRPFGGPAPEGDPLPGSQSVGDQIFGKFGLTNSGWNFSQGAFEKVLDEDNAYWMSKGRPDQVVHMENLLPNGVAAPAQAPANQPGQQQPGEPEKPQEQKPGEPEKPEEPKDIDIDGGDEDEEDEEHAAEKAGSVRGKFSGFRNFLATDKLPPSLFGYRIVASAKDYTDDDLRFFKDHPEAGGFYDLADGEGEETEPDEQAEETPEAPQPEHGGLLAGVPMLASIIGPAGARQHKKTTGESLGDLAKAKTMKQEAGESSVEFKRRMISQTGWQLDGGYWKYETPVDPKLRQNVVQQLTGPRVTAKLTDALDYSATPELLTAYPQLSSMRVIFAGREGDPLGDALRARGGTGIALPHRGVIVVDPYTGKGGALDVDTLTKTLLHEPTHVTDEIELGPQTDAYGKYRRLPGMTGDEAYIRAETEVNARNVERRRDMTPEQRRSVPLSDTADVKEEDRVVR